MRHLFIVITTIACICQSALGADPVDRGADEAAIRQAVDAYVAAYNAGDGKALAALWLPSAVYVIPDSGVQVAGREAIEALFVKRFAEVPGGKLEAQTESIEFISPNVAIEAGTAKVTGADQKSEESEYTAVFIKHDGQWLLDRVTEEEILVEPSNYDHLKDLEWMIGSWIDQDDVSSIETTCQWTKNQNFIIRWFKVSVLGRTDMAGFQIVGWDPTTQKIRSWVFDSSGGFGEGTWTRKNDTWYIHATGTEADGRKSSAVNIMKQIDQNTMSWQSVNRVTGGELLPNVDETIVVRQPSAE
ncbi:YybH family protein [Planctomicrobium sp. SH661]|uniref:YybH family protein n=1 Tax=Planctomicrobium sp. SH661 TaxID=3448124 RepID=UPI003F5BB89B